MHLAPRLIAQHATLERPTKCQHHTLCAESLLETSAKRDAGMDHDQNLPSIAMMVIPIIWTDVAALAGLSVDGNVGEVGYK
jgi:hypothetical protein